MGLCASSSAPTAPAPEEKYVAPGASPAVVADPPPAVESAPSKSEETLPVARSSLRRMHTLRSRLTGQAHHHRTRTVRVFVSSTFRDFALERDMLMRRTLPRLREICAEKGLTVVLVDLRWGVTSEESGRGDVVKLCLEEIDACCPFFIGMLGNRYGWHLTGQGDESLLNTTMDKGIEAYPWVADYRSRSVTELEILHGALLHKDEGRHAFFYFRDHEKFLEREGKKISREDRGSYESESPHAAAGQKALKDQIEQGGWPVMEYQRVHDMCDQIVKDLEGAIQKEWPGSSSFTAIDKIRLQHEAFAGTRLMGYVGNEELIAELDIAVAKYRDGYAAESTEVATVPLIVTSEKPGYGKSALLANWAEHYNQRHDDVIIVTHFVGCDPDSTGMPMMLRRIMKELAERLEMEDEGKHLEEMEKNHHSALDDLVHYFPEFLSRARHAAVSRNLVLVIIIDAMDQLANTVYAGSPTFALSWLPAKGLGVPFFLSATLEGPGGIKTEFGKNLTHIAQSDGWKQRVVRELSREERGEVISGYLKAHAKKLDAAQTNLVLDSESAKNPLYLRTLLDEARLFGNFFELTNHLKVLLSAKDCSELYGKVLRRMGEDFGVTLVKKVTAHIYCSRDGLTDHELQASLHSHDHGGEVVVAEAEAAAAGRSIEQRNKFQALLRGLRNQLCSLSGMMSFYHTDIRIAVKEFVQDEGIVASQRRLVDFWTHGEAHGNVSQFPSRNLLRSKDLDEISMLGEAIKEDKEHRKRTLRELPTLYAKLKQWDELAQFLSRPTNFISFAESTSNKLDLLNLWNKYKESRKDSADVVNASIEQLYDSSVEEWLLSDPAMLAAERDGSSLERMEMESKCFGCAAETMRETLGRPDVALRYMRRQLPLQEQLCKEFRELHEKDNGVTLSKDELRRQEQTLSAVYLQFATLLEETTGNNVEEALKMKQRALAIDEKYLDDPESDVANVAVTISNIARSHVEVGNYAEAMIGYERALKMQRRRGAERSDVATTLVNLSSVYESKGNLSEARGCMMEAMAIRQKVFGVNNPEVARTMVNLAALDRAQGKYEEAKDRVISAIAMLEGSVLGSEHPMVAWALDQLGQILQTGLKDYDGSEKHLLRALHIREARYGTNHNKVGEICLNLGSVNQDRWFASGKDEEDIFEDRLGVSHVTTAYALHNLGLLYYERFDPDAEDEVIDFPGGKGKGSYVDLAREHLQRALEIRVAELGEAHPSTTNTREAVEAIDEDEDEDL